MKLLSNLVGRFGEATTIRGALAGVVLGMGALGSAHAATLTCGPGSTPLRVNTASAWSSDAVYGASAGGTLPGTPAALVTDYKWNGWFNPTTTNHPTSAGTGSLAGTPLQGKWLSFGDAQFKVGQPNAGNTTTGNYPLGSNPYPAVRTNGSTAAGQWVQNAVTFTSNDKITVAANVDLSTIKIRGSKALDDDGWFVVIPSAPPSGATHFIQQTVVGGGYAAPVALSLDGSTAGLGFYYGDNTIGFAVRNTNYADTTSQGNPTGLFADFTITADCLTPVAPQPTAPLVCAAGNTTATTVKIGPFTTNARDWKWTRRTVSNTVQNGDYPIFDDYRFRDYFNPASLTGAVNTPTAPTAARWLSPGTVHPAGADVPGVPYPVATGQNGTNGVVLTMNQPITIGSNINLGTIKLEGRFGFDNYGDSVFVNGIGTGANDLPDIRGSFFPATTPAITGFVVGQNTIGLGLNGGEASNDCPGGTCAMAAIAEFYVTAQCTGADPQPLTVDQSINFPQPTTPRPLSSGSFTAGASATSGLPVSYASTTPSVCTVNATTGVVTPVSAGVCTITADQAGGTANGVTYNAATQVTRTVTLAPAAVKQPQTITFPPQTSPQTVSQGDLVPIGPAATASSNLPVTYTSLTPSVCTVVGGAVRVLSTGTCTLQADQPGNANFDPAASVTRSIFFNGLPIAGLVAVPALDAAGLGLLSLLGAAAGALTLRRRKRAAK